MTFPGEVPLIDAHVRVGLVHNEYGKPSGEESVVNALEASLLKNGHRVARFSRSSAEIERKRFGKIQAFLAGVYNPFSRAAFSQFLDVQKPEVVHIHNLYPFISASILPECRRRNMPVVMTLHNYRLICPNALLMRSGELCHKCVGGREWNCVLHNCERNIFKSAGYAARTAFARKSGWFSRDVRQFICLTNFQRDLYAGAGFPRDRMTVIPNPALESRTGETSARRLGEYVAYIGRVSPEKDIDTLMAAARALPDIPFKVAGSYWRMPQVVRQAPPNMQFLGHVGGAELRTFYERSRIVVFATRCYENFPSVLLEAMSFAVPLVCTRIGALPEIVEEGRTGLLYETRNRQDLADKIRWLWNEPEKCREMGLSGFRKAGEKYSADSVYRRTLAVYTKALEQ